MARRRPLGARGSNRGRRRKPRQRGPLRASPARHGTLPTVDEASAPLPPEALRYYARGQEAARLEQGHGLLEFARTRPGRSRAATRHPRRGPRRRERALAARPERPPPRGRARPAGRRIRRARGALPAPRASSTVMNARIRSPRGTESMNRGPRRLVLPLALTLMALAILTDPARSEIRLPPGFVKEVYVTGQGFATGRGSRGIPATSTLVFDHAGSLFLARTGARYQNAETDDLTPVYRVPPGGGRLTPDTEARFLYGPPLRNVQAVRGPRRPRAVRDDLRPGPAARRSLPAGRRARRALRGRHAAPERRAPAPPAGGDGGRLGRTPLRRRSGIGRRGPPRSVGPRARSALRRGAAAPGAGDGCQRHALDRRGRQRRGALAARARARSGASRAMARRRSSCAGRCRPRSRRARAATSSWPTARGASSSPSRRMASASPSSATPRETRRAGLAFAPDTPATRRAGVAGDLFVATINQGAWTVNEVVRISGPFDELIRQRAAASP